MTLVYVDAVLLQGPGCGIWPSSQNLPFWVQQMGQVIKTVSEAVRTEVHVLSDKYKNPDNNAIPAICFSNLW